MRLFGLESEIASGLDGGLVCDVLSNMARASASLPSDGHPDASRFYANGARAYYDCRHPELCTPECANPVDVVRYKEAMHQLLWRAAAGTSVRLSRCNVDYRTRSTFGEHESYGYRCGIKHIITALMSFMVSRIVLTGAGGLNALHGGIVFTVSPRSVYHAHPTAEGSTVGRGIIHLKNEPLDRMMSGRLHLTFGENLCSHRGTYLKVGTTALVLGLIEAGCCDVRAITFDNPVDVVRAFSSDPTASVAMETTRGRAVTARDVQYCYLRQVENHLFDDWMPEWAPDVVRLWRETLDGLATPERLAGVLDWPLKYALFTQHIERRGFDWDEIIRLNDAFPEDAGPNYCDDPTGCTYCKAITDRQIRSEERACSVSGEYPRGRLHEFLRLRNELCEIDFRYGAFNDDGIFRSLDAAGLLHHQVDGVTSDTIHDAMSEPPAYGSALKRGTMIKQAVDANRPAFAYWDCIEYGDNDMGIIRV